MRLTIPDVDISFIIKNREVIRISPKGVFIRGKQVDSTDIIYRGLQTRGIRNVKLQNEPNVDYPNIAFISFQSHNKIILQLDSDNDYIVLKNRKSKGPEETFKYFKIWLAFVMLLQ